MKNKILSLLILLVTFSCSKTPKYASGEIREAERKIHLMKSNRLLADVKADSCLMDDLTEERVLEEIKKLENNGLPVSKGIIGGIDLSKFPPSQSNYLERNKEWIFSSSVNYKGCTDLKCIFNRIYPSSNALEGLLNYYFFLKMGYALSSVETNQSIIFPTNITTDKGVEIKNYVYTYRPFPLNEMKNFFYLSKTLPASFQKLSTLTSLHRRPLSNIIDKYPTACGLAGGPLNKGWIILMDNCLTRDTNSLFGGNFFSHVTHELTHRLDHTLLPGGKNFSETKEWLDLSGWYKIENNDSKGNADPKWAHSRRAEDGLQPDGFIRDYASTSPGEDFADTIAYGRFEADKTASTSPGKFKWIVKNIFGGRSFAASGVTEAYSTFLSEYALKDLPNIINSCVDNKSSYQYILTDEQVISYKEYDPPLIECIFGGVERSLAVAIKSLKSNEAEACDFFASSEVIIKSRVLESIDELIKKDLNRNIEIGKQLKILAEFATRLSDEIDPREIFIKCQDPKKEENQAPKSSMECFSGELNTEFQKVAIDYKEKIPNQLEAYEASYINENSFLAVKSRIVSLFSQIYAGSELTFKAEAKRKWKTCFESPVPSLADAQELTLYPFNGGSQYIKKSLLNCLNHHSEEELTNVLEKTGKKLGISISSLTTKKFILEMYLSHYTSALQALVAVEKNVESAKINEANNQATQKVVSAMTTDTTWIGIEARSDADLFSACQDKAKNDIEKAQETQRIEEYNFHSPSNLWNEVICSSILSNPKVLTLIENNSTMAVKKAIPKLTGLIINEAEPTMTKCKNQFSRNSTIIIKSRNLCLTNPITWSSIVDDTIKRWMKDENISFISSADKRGRDYLDANKNVLKDQATKKMNAIK